MGLPAGDGQTIGEIARIAVLPGSLVERAEALLEPLYRLMRYDGAWIGLLDPERRVQPPLISLGYPARVQQYLNSPGLVDDIELTGLHRRRPPMRVKDMPVAPPELPVWADYLHPAGFREGIAVPLTTPDGRHLGVFAATTETSTPPSDAVRDQLAALAPLIARAVDPMRTIHALTAMVAGAVAGVVLTRGGNTVALPGLPGDRLVTAGSPMLATVSGLLASGQLQAMFLAPCDDTDGASLVRVTALAVSSQPPGHLRAVVLLSPPPDLRGLTRRELQVLGLMITGCPVAQIAAALCISVSIVTDHVDHIMVKLDAGSRVVAAVRAQRQGLYLPADLAAPQASGGER